MKQPSRFEALLERVRRGDPQAIAQFVHEYEALIQRSVRGALRYFRLHRLIDSTDISQAVLSDFFQHDLASRVGLKSREQLIRMLRRMARNKVMDEARKSHADCRDRRRLEVVGSGQLAELSLATEASPSTIVADDEMVNEIYSRMTVEERLLVQSRLEGANWSRLARRHGMRPDAVRKKLHRAIERVGRAVRRDLLHA